MENFERERTIRHTFYAVAVNCCADRVKLFLYALYTLNLTCMGLERYIYIYKSAAHSPTITIITIIIKIIITIIIKNNICTNSKESER